MNSSWSCCNYVLCRRFADKLSNDQFRPVPLTEMDESNANGGPGYRKECIQLDTASMGQQVVVVKNGKRICGNGAALTNCPISQNKAYFEVKVQSAGTWGVGLATPKVNLDTVPLGRDSNSWVLRENCQMWHNGHQVSCLDVQFSNQGNGSASIVNSPKSTIRSIQEGDIIGVTYDHEELCFRINGETNPSGCMRGMKGCLYPVVYVDDGAILDTEFINFRQQIPSGGFSEIMFEKRML